MIILNLFHPIQNKRGNIVEADLLCLFLSFSLNRGFNRFFNYELRITIIAILF